MFAGLPRGAAGGFMSFTTYSDGWAQSPTGNGTFTVLNTGAGVIDLPVDQVTGTVMDVALMNFDLSTLPANATITGASFVFATTVITANPSRTVDIEGFSTTGSVNLVDATAAGTLLGSYDSFALGLGNQSVSLSVAALDTLLGPGAVGVRLEGLETTNTAIVSLEGAPVFNKNAPQLAITFSVIPEPSALTLMTTAGLVGLAGYGWRRRVRG
jgi:hypothetical protein